MLDLAPSRMEILWLIALPTLLIRGEDGTLHPSRRVEQISPTQVPTGASRHGVPWLAWTSLRLRDWS